jgi:hypothetical protein
MLLGCFGANTGPTPSFFGRTPRLVLPEKAKSGGASDASTLQIFHHTRLLKLNPPHLALLFSEIVHKCFREEKLEKPPAFEQCLKVHAQQYYLYGETVLFGRRKCSKKRGS